MKKGGITRSTGFQVLLYFLLAAGTLIAVFCTLMTIKLWEDDADELSFSEYKYQLMEEEAYRHLSYICEDERSFPTVDHMIEAFDAESAVNNVKYAIYDIATTEIIWANTSKFTMNLYYSYDQYFTRPQWSVLIDKAEPASEREYRAVLFVDGSLAKIDVFRSLTEWAEFWYERLEQLYIGAIAGWLTVILCVVWILCNAGHRWHREGIMPGVLSNIYLDLFSAFFAVGAFFIVLFAAEFLAYHSDFELLAAELSVFAAVEAVWITLYLREVALRFKLGKWWRHTLLYRMCQVIGRVCGFVWKGMRRVLTHLPEVYLVVIGLAFLTLCEFLGIVYLVPWNKEEVLSLWMLEKLLVIPLVLYCALAFGKLRKGSRAMAKGDLSQKLDTKYLYLHFKEHARDLNQINSGISKAVEERLQSERLKTELITNVSHDLKTPLTSVINYADLLAVAADSDADNRDAQVKEYSEVLFRQANRLKKLLEDLVEASKAATGNVELQLQPCELGVVLTQAVGEYEERMEQKQLKLILKKTEEEIHIWADGRQLWRVIENLMNNICKYAQEGSRVYLSMEKKADRVELIFRNISKYELDIAPGELTERFVRGDASRHMEGSGLGLSIAKSLVELQNGTMEIYVDGDLFKVVLSFEIYA